LFPKFWFYSADKQDGFYRVLLYFRQINDDDDDDIV